MADELRGKKIAALVDNGFEQSELLEPKKALEQAGAEVHVVSPQNGEVKGWQHTDWGEKVKVDRGLSAARAADYDGLLLPGGVMNPDHLRGKSPGSGVREGVRHREQADRGDLPRPVDAHRGRGGEGPPDDVMAVAARPI